MPWCVERTIPITEIVYEDFINMGNGVLGHLMVEAAPPRRIASLCSVKGTILVRGYSRATVGSRRLVG